MYLGAFRNNRTRPAELLNQFGGDAAARTHAAPETPHEGVFWGGGESLQRSQTTRPRALGQQTAPSCLAPGAGCLWLLVKPG